MLIKNGLVFTSECQFAMMDVLVKDDRIAAVAPAGTLEDENVIDAKGGYVLPGFVDIHSHGAVGHDICDSSEEGLKAMLSYYGKNGVTSVVPATMSFNQPILTDVIKAAVPFFDKEGHGAVLRGVNMEGPFFNVEKCGAQNPEYIMDPDYSMFDSLYELSGGYIKLVDIAPELPGSIEFVKKACEKCVVSIAHTNANYDQSSDAFKAGASHATHLFNAMPPFGHRDPGVIGAAFDKAEFVELICDGIHVHPSAVRSVFVWFGEDRVCLISDSVRGAGLPDGEYDLGGQMVIIKEGRATVAGTDTLAGSTTSLAECCRRAIGFGVPIEQAVRAATINPAKAVGLDAEVGSLKAKKRADIVIWDKDLKTQAVFVGGKATEI